MKKISKRINKICNLIPNDTSLIYDLCCDHGLIGLEAYKRDESREVVFVDIVPSIIAHLRSYIPKSSNLTVLKKDAKKLKVKLNKPTLFIISGIGAELAIKIFENLYKQAPDANFIFCTHQKTEYLKENLMKTKLGIIASDFIIEKNQGYEIILLSNKATKPIAIFDPSIYDYGSEKHQLYIKNLIKYYQTKQKFEPSDQFRRYLNELDLILASF